MQPVYRFQGTPQETIIIVATGKGKRNPCRRPSVNLTSLCHLREYKGASLCRLETITCPSACCERIVPLSNQKKCHFCVCPYGIYTKMAVWPFLYDSFMVIDSFGRSPLSCDRGRIAGKDCCASNASLDWSEQI